MTGRSILSSLVLAAGVLRSGCGAAEPANGQPGQAIRLDTLPLPTRLTAIADAIEAQRRSLGVPGAAVVIVRDDRVLLLRGFGLRDAEAGLPVTPQTLFHIGSCTKPFTALAAVISADHGVVSLDDPPRKFLSYFTLRDPEADAKVTLRDLLSHRTGVPGWSPASGNGAS